MKSLPHQQTINIGNTKLEFTRSGTGSPTIVLINGSGGPIEGWYRVFTELETLGTVFAYNRPGIGKSSKPTSPQTGEVMVETLRALLHAAELPPPYLLVAHSLGGLVANLFARHYPSDVMGMVLLDATAPADIDVMAACESPLQRFLKSTLDLVLGKDTHGETTHVRRTVELIDQAPSFPDLPLLVVTGGKPAMSWLTPKQALEARAEHQRQLASISPRGKQVVAAKSGHFPQLSEPEVVVQAVRDAIELASIGRNS
ncbi:alpha/beta hydrolase [bacterium]|nr:alpha/beta hydrolase [bacterium]